MRALLRTIACVALVSLTASAAQAAPPRCVMERLTATGATRLFRTDEYGGPVSAWLSIVATGSGTPSVAVTLVGPPITGGESGLLATPAPAGTPGARPAALLCTLNAATSVCDGATSGAAQSLSAYGLIGTLSGCTSCDVWIGLCTRDH